MNGFAEFVDATTRAHYASIDALVRRAMHTCALSYLDGKHNGGWWQVERVIQIGEPRLTHDALRLTRHLVMPRVKVKLRWRWM